VEQYVEHYHGTEDQPCSGPASQCQRGRKSRPDSEKMTADEALQLLAWTEEDRDGWRRQAQYEDKRRASHATALRRIATGRYPGYALTPDGPSYPTTKRMPRKMMMQIARTELEGP